MIDRPYNENLMENFKEAEYSIIHGTNDDNVHFLHSTQMQKRLTGLGIDFDSGVRMKSHFFRLENILVILIIFL